MSERHDSKRTLADRKAEVQCFFADCLTLLDKKGTQYNHVDDPYGDVWDSCRVLGTTPLGVNFIHMRKHLQALARFVQGAGDSQMESVRSRLMDLANYAALTAVLEDWWHEDYDTEDTLETR